MKADIMRDRDTETGTRFYIVSAHTTTGTRDVWQGVVAGTAEDVVELIAPWDDAELADVLDAGDNPTEALEHELALANARREREPDLNADNYGSPNRQDDQDLIDAGRGHLIR